MQFEKEYQLRLWESGVAALAILQEQVKTEINYGNWKNIPSSVLGIHILSLVPQLFQMFDEGKPLGERYAHEDEIISTFRWLKARETEECRTYAAHALAELATQPFLYEEMRRRGMRAAELNDYPNISPANDPAA